MYYRPKKGVAADVIPFYEDGEFKLAYLQDFRDIPNEGEGCPWNLLTTSNLVDYIDHGPIIERGTIEEQDLYIFTGSIFKHQDEYYVFYTGHNPHLRRKGFPEQKILLAKGKSLYQLKKVKEFSFEAPFKYEQHDFRDPFVYLDEQDGLFKMLITARKKQGYVNYRGVTLIAYSNDLFNWQIEEDPFYAPDSYFAHECPDYFKMGDWYYLLFSEFSDRVVTRYRYAKNPRGPWLTPKNDTFDGHAYYAAKSVSDGNKRYLFGWNPIKLDEKDLKSWQWGGNIIPHEIYQLADGTLAVRIPESIKEAYKHQEILQIKNKHHVEMNGVDIQSAKNVYSYVRFERIPKKCYIKADFRIEEIGSDFGFFFNMNDNYNEGYFIKFDPEHQRLAFDRLPHQDPTVHLMIDTERKVELDVGKENHLDIILDGSIIEVYVNSLVAMSARMFDFNEGDFGIYSNHSKVTFKNIKVYAKGENK